MAFKDGFKEFPVLTTEKLVLDSVQPDDAKAIYQQMQELPRNTSWVNSYEAQSVEKASVRIRHYTGAFRRKQSIHWAIRQHKGRNLIGVCRLFEFSYQFKAEIGYWIGRRHWNKGYATEAVKAVVTFAFDVLELHRVYAQTNTTNTASQRVLEKSGFHREGCLKGDSVNDGQFRDTLVYGIVNPKDDIHRWLGKEWTT